MPQFQDILLRNHARVGNHAKRVNVRCALDDASCFLTIRLGPKTSVYEKHVSVKSTVQRCDVTNCATTLQGFNKHTPNTLFTRTHAKHPHTHQTQKPTKLNINAHVKHNPHTEHTYSQT